MLPSFCCDPCCGVIDEVHCCIRILELKRDAEALVNFDLI